MGGNVRIVSKAYKEAAVNLANAAQHVIETWYGTKIVDLGPEMAKPEHPMHDAIVKLAWAIGDAKLPTTQRTAKLDRENMDL